MTKQRVDRIERRQERVTTSFDGAVTKANSDISITKISIRGDGLPNPGWRDFIKRAQGASTVLSGNVYRFKDTGGDITLIVKQSLTDKRRVKRDAFGQLVGAENPPTGDATLATSAQQECAVSFLNFCNDKLHYLQGLVVAGEAMQTGRMIRDRARAIARGLENLLDRYRRIKRRKRPRNSKPVVDQAANAWLEASYGWRPLIGDIHDGVEALNENLNQWRKQVEPAWATVKLESRVASSELTGGQFSGLLPFRVHSVSQNIAECRYKGAVKIEFDGARRFDPALFGVDKWSFIPAVWELIPYSFLVDYFSNVGDVLDAWSFPLSSLAWCNETLRTGGRLRLSTRLLVPQVKASWGEQFISYTGDPGTSEAEYMSFQRTGEFPKVSLRSFRLQNNLNPVKIINLVALGITHRRLLPFR